MGEKKMVKVTDAASENESEIIISEGRNKNEMQPDLIGY